MGLPCLNDDAIKKLTKGALKYKDEPILVLPHSTLEFVAYFQQPPNPRSPKLLYFIELEQWAGNSPRCGQTIKYATREGIVCQISQATAGGALDTYNAQTGQRVSAFANAVRTGEPGNWPVVRVKKASPGGVAEIEVGKLHDMVDDAGN